MNLSRLAVRSFGFLASALFTLAFAAPAPIAPGPASSRRLIDFVDPSYGAHIRQIFNPAGNEHNLYHYRSVFNADNSRLLGIETPAGSSTYHVTLYDGDGRFLKRLFTPAEYDWTVVWDRHDPRYFYTRKNGTVFRYDVEASRAEPLRTFEKPALTSGPSGLSLNQSGDRLLVRHADNSVRTFRLPALDDERICRIEIPAGFTANWDKLRFTGHRDFFALTLEPASRAASASPAATPAASPARAQTRIYDALTGALLHTHEGVNVGHHDFSSAGKFAYVAFPFNQAEGLRLHVVNLDGTDNRVVFTAPPERLRFVRNYHITWPAGTPDTFLLSFFPQTGRLPRDYQPYLDELIEISVDGRHRILARTGTTCADDFWTQPQQSPSADGSRILFHSNRTATVGRLGGEPSGTLDQFILYRDRPPPARE